MKEKIKKTGFGLSITFNVIFLSIVIWGLSGGFMQLLKKQIIQPYQYRLITQFDLLDVQPGSTVFLGNSITEGGKWYELFPKSNVYNRGIISDVSAEVLVRLDQITKGKPAQIFLLIGTNDLAFGTPQSDIVSNIVSIIEKIHHESPQTEVFVQSILPRSEEYQSRIEALNLNLETAIAGLATWVNLYPLFLNKEGTSLNNSLSNDGLHLLGQGYIVWRDAIDQYVKKEYKSNPE